MKQHLVTILPLVLIALFFAPTVSAQTITCAPIFNGGSACVQDKDFSVNKQIQEPGSKAFRENLAANSNRFSAGQTIIFHIIVKNTSNGDLSNMTITDSLPGYVLLRKVDGQTNGANNQTFSAQLNKLAKGASKTYTLETQVVTADKLPSSPSPLCVSNQALAKIGNQTSSDIATFCINNDKRNISATNSPSNTSTNNQSAPTGTSKGGLPVYSQITPTQTPGTGPEVFSLVSLALPFLSGIYLRKRGAKQ
jgi:uncharacterized repeat protein (TIGR01451 family)